MRPAGPVFAVLAVEPSTRDGRAGRAPVIGVVRCTPGAVMERYRTPIDADGAAQAVRERLVDAAPVGHEVAATLDQLRSIGIRATRPPLDTRAVAEMLDPAARSYALADLCERYRLRHEAAGSALGQAEAVRMLLIALRSRWSRLHPAVQRKLAALDHAMGFESPLRVFIDTAPSGRDLAPLRTRAQPRRPSNPAHREPERPARVKLPPGSLRSLTGTVFDAAAGRAGSRMERREEQRAMALDVARALDLGRVALIEAGTGVGKSLAYLVPSAIWAVSSGRRVMIITHTKNLQSQLSENDVTRLRTMLRHVSPRVADMLAVTVLRGRNNYLCRRNLDREFARVVDPDRGINAASVALLARVMVWAESTVTGDREELRIAPAEEEAWDRLSASNASCLSDGCPYVEQGTCFLDRAYRRAERAHLIIGNQWLLIASLLTEQSRVPTAPVVIIDEAHFLEEVATDMLARELSEAQFERALNRVGTGDARRRNTLALRATKLALPDAAKLRSSARAAQVAYAAAWESFEKFHAECGDERAGDQRLRLTASVRARPGWQRVEARWRAAQTRLRELQVELNALAQEAATRAKDARGSQQSELTAFAEDARDIDWSLEQAMCEADEIIDADPALTVAWIDRETERGSAPELRLRSAPLNVGAMLHARLWSRDDLREAIVLTGATLTVGDRWDFLRRRLMLPRALESQHGSPFDFKANAPIFVATDMPPPPSDGPPDEYEDALAAAIPQLVRAAGGRTLALFTSYAAMDRVADRIRESLEMAGIRLVVQRRDGSAVEVIEALKAAPHTVVFGVSSLWTGVDVPGDHLSLLIVTRIRFDHPKDPVHAARAEQYRDGFREMSLPLAILRLRQGFGRLIRSRSDRGVVVILDKRVITRDYGRVLLQALAPSRVRRMAVDEIAVEVEAFLAADPAELGMSATIERR